MSVKSPLGAVHPEIAAVVEATGKTLSALGHDVAEGQLPEGTLEEFLPLWQLQIAQMPVLPWRRSVVRIR